MKKIALLFTIFALTGCATNGDIENLQGQIDALAPKVAAASNSASEAKALAAQASARAGAAEQAANLAAQYAKDTNEKLDRLFNKTQYK
jgi:murein lipoprotein